MTQDVTATELIARLAALRARIEAALQKPQQDAFYESDAKTNADLDKAMKVCAEAEKLAREGKVRQAMEKETECTKLIGRAGL